MNRALALLAMRPALSASLLTCRRRRELDELVRIVDQPAAAVTSFDDVDPAVLARVDILITGWGCPRIGPAELDRLERLRAIVHTAGSVKGVFDEAVWRRGVRVTTAASANAVPVAEYALAMILLAGKNVLLASRRYETVLDRGTLTEGYPFVGNLHRVVGLVGLSRTGRLLAQRLAAGFDHRVLAADPYAGDVPTGVELTDLDSLLIRASIVSLHAPHTPETERIIGARELGLMPDGGTLINTARGELVDQDALLAEVEAGRLNAVLDVTTPEPLPLNHPLRSLPNVVITPHLAGAQGDELYRLGDQAVEEVRRWVSGQPPLDPVRFEDLPVIA